MSMWSYLGYPDESTSAPKKKEEKQPPPPPPPSRRPPPPSSRPPPPSSRPPPPAGPPAPAPSTVSAAASAMGLPTSYFGSLFGTDTSGLNQNNPHSSTATTSDHPYPVNPRANAPYSLSTPLLPRHEEDKEKIPIYNWDPIEHTYKSVQKKKEMPSSDEESKSESPQLHISSCTPIHVAFEDVPGFQERKSRFNLSRFTTGTATSEENADDECEQGPGDGDKESSPGSSSPSIEDDIKKDWFINKYLASISGLSDKERKEMRLLHKFCVKDKLSIKMSQEATMGDFVLSYFSHLSSTNPDAKGCWSRWLAFRDDTGPLKDVNFYRINQFFESGLFNIAYDCKKRPVVVINTRHYNDSFGPEITAKATVLFFTSLFWNLKTNEFDLFGLRNGITILADLSHYSINMLSWNVIAAVKQAAIAFPFSLVEIYCVNTPTFVYLLRQVASKILVAHTMDKLKVLGETKEYIREFGNAEKTPVENGGTWDMTASKWMKERGFLRDEKEMKGGSVDAKGDSVSEEKSAGECLESLD